LELQKTLAAVQLEDTTYRLSERNCIEIVMKLKEMGLIELFYTTNGKEYLTPRQLRLEIEDELTSSGGRIQLSDLQPIINVDSLLIEKIATKYAEEDEEVMLLTGELITEWYLDRVCLELNEELHSGEGLCTTGQLASRFNLPVKTLQQMIEKRLGTILKATFKGGLLYTEVYERKQTAKIRGVLSAITRPISIPQIASFYGFEDNVVEVTLRKLIKEGRVAGHLRGREWAPAVFTQAQRKCVDEFFAQNGYLEYKRAQNLQIPKPGQFVKVSYPDAVDLHDTVVSRTIVNNLEANLEETIRSNSWSETAAFLPPVLSVYDVGLLLNKVCKERKGEIMIFADQFMVSKGFTDECLSKFQEPAEAKAQAVAKERKPALAKSISSSTTVDDYVVVNAEPEETNEGGKKRAKKGSKKGKKGRRGDYDSEEDMPAPPPQPASKKDKKKDKRRGKSGSSAASNIQQEAPEEYITLEEVEEKLLTWYPDVEGHPELSSGLADDLLRRVQALYDAQIAAALSTIHHGDTAERRKRQKLFEEKFDQQYADLQLFVKGFQMATAGIDSMHPLSQALEDHILSSFCMPFACFITTHICFLNQVHFRESSDSNEEEIAHSSKTLVEPLSADEKERLQGELPKDVWQAVKGVWAFALGSKKSLLSFLSHCEDNSFAHCDVIPRKLDKKKEKQALFLKRHELVAQISACDDITIDTFKFALSLLFQQVKNSIMNLPDDLEVLSNFLDSFSNDLVESKLQCCLRFKQLLLSKNSEESEEDNIGSGSEMSEDEKQDLIQEIKQISISKK